MTHNFKGLNPDSNLDLNPTPFLPNPNPDSGFQASNPNPNPNPAKICLNPDWNPNPDLDLHITGRHFYQRKFTSCDVTHTLCHCSKPTGPDPKYFTTHPHLWNGCWKVALGIGDITVSHLSVCLSVCLGLWELSKSCEFFSSDFFRWTVRQTDRQKTMHKSPSCISTGGLNKIRQN